MTEMYVILGWMGWIAFLMATAFAAGYLKAERDARRRNVGWAPPTVSPDEANRDR